MGRTPCCDKENVKRGSWSPEEDAKLKEFIEKQVTGSNWISLPQKAGLRRCGKSCRLRWLNYLRPNIKHGEFSDDEDKIICSLFASMGSRWSIIANHLPGRTDNDIKNYWNTKLKKKLLGMTPNQHLKKSHLSYPLPSSNTNNDNSNSLLQNYSMPSPYSFSQAYESGSSNYYSTMAFTTPNSSTTTLLQAQDGCFSPTTQVSYNRNNNSNFLIFGGEAASCSSSDLGLQSYFTNGGSVGDEKAEGAYGENPLDYSIEEIKQLISINSVCNNSLNFFDDIIKTENKEIYY